MEEQKDEDKEEVTFIIINDTKYDAVFWVKNNLEEEGFINFNIDSREKKELVFVELYPYVTLTKNIPITMKLENKKNYNLSEIIDYKYLLL